MSFGKRRRQNSGLDESFRFFSVIIQFRCQTHSFTVGADRNLRLENILNSTIYLIETASTSVFLGLFVRFHGFLTGKCILN